MARKQTRFSCYVFRRSASNFDCYAVVNYPVDNPPCYTGVAWPPNPSSVVETPLKYCAQHFLGIRFMNVWQWLTSTIAS